MIAQILKIFCMIVAVTANAETEDSPKDTVVNLNKIPIVQDSVMHPILRDVFSDVSELGSDKSTYYIVDITASNNLYNVRVTRHSRKNLPTGIGCVGYDIYNGKTLFIFNDGKYKLPQPMSQAPMAFKVVRPIPCPYDPDEWEYLIKDNTFARYVFGIGWLWDRSMNTNNNNKSKNVIAPKRMKK